MTPNFISFLVGSIIFLCYIYYVFTEEPESERYDFYIVTEKRNSDEFNLQCPYCRHTFGDDEDLNKHSIKKHSKL